MTTRSENAAAAVKRGETASPELTRVVLLGASNLTRSISIVVETIRRCVPGRLEYLIAMGHGRSYGMPSRILWRGLSGITESTLWSKLGTTSTVPTIALLTDVGNDIAYGAPADAIIGWVATCLERLRAVEATVVVTGLPVGSIDSLGPLRFGLARRLFFPGRSISLSEAKTQANALNEQLERRAHEHEAHFVEQKRSWYGIDPLHMRLHRLGEAWSHLLGPLENGQHARPRATASVRRWWAIRSRSPDHWTLLDRPRGRTQPSGHMPDGTPVSLF